MNEKGQLHLREEMEFVINELREGKKTMRFANVRAEVFYANECESSKLTQPSG